MISSAVVMSGCGAGGEGTGSADLAKAIEQAVDNNTADDTTASGGSGSSAEQGQSNPYAGDSLIEGAVALSSLVGLDANALEPGEQTPKRPQISVRSAFVSPRTGSTTADNAVVKLYSVADNGDLEDTGIVCKFSDEKTENGDPKYFCDGVKDGNSYVVKYVRLLEGNKAIEMKVNVDLPEGATEVPAEEISPKTTVVVDAIIKAVLSATEGKEIDPQVVKDIVKSVKSTIETLVETGAVQIPSMVVEAPKDEDGNFVADVRELAEKKKVRFSENENLEEVAGALASNEEIVKEVDVARVEIEVRELKKIDTDSDDGKRKLVKKIFSKLLGEDDVPRFIVEFFANQYIAGKVVSLDELFGSVYAGLKLNPGFAMTIDELELTDAKAASALTRLLGRIYDLQEKKAAGSLDEDEKKRLAEIPSAITMAFPAEQWRGRAITPATEFSVPQGIVFTIFVTDKLVPEIYENKTGEKLAAVMKVESSGDDDGGDKGAKVEFDNPVDFNPMAYDPAGNNPGLMQLFGFFDEENLARLDGVDVTHVEIMPDRIWIEGETTDGGPGGKEYDALRANVCLMDMAAMRQMASDENGDPQEADLSVELSYPMRNGRIGTVALVNERGLFKRGPGPVDQQGPAAENGGDPEACFVLDPWANASPDGGRPSLADIVSDFTSGEYKVVVKKAGAVVAERKIKRKIITGMRNASPTLLSPRGMPKWPAACEGKDFCPEWQELQAKWEAAGGNTTFAINADSDKDGNEDKARIVVKWDKPEVELPDGVKIAYALSIFRNGGCDENGCDFENIFSSYEKGRRIFGRSFTVPKLLDKLEIGKGSYNVNVCAEFIDTESGEFLGAGGCAFADFNVGDPLDLSRTFDIKGEAPKLEDASWKVALISEAMPKFGEAPADRPEAETLLVSTIEDGKYALSPMLGDFLDKSVNTMFNIVMFKDEDGDDVVDFPTPDEPGEMVFWPGWESQVRFETWGRVLRVVSEKHGDSPDDFKRREVIVTGGEEVKGPSFEGIETRFHDVKPLDPTPAGAPEPEGEFQPYPGGQEPAGEFKPYPDGQTPDGEFKPYPEGPSPDGGFQPYPDGQAPQGEPLPLPEDGTAPLPPEYGVETDPAGVTDAAAGDGTSAAG